MCVYNLKLVTLDVTNTLLKFKVPPWQYYTMVAKEYGYKDSEHNMKQKFKHCFKIMSQNHPNYGVRTIQWENWWRRFVCMTLRDQLPANTDVNCIANLLIDAYKTTKCWTIADGSEQFLKTLKNNHIILGVISNFDPRLHEILCNFKLDKTFDFVLTSYEYGYSKPDKRIFQTAIDMCEDVQPTEALHIGDDVEKDYMGAKAAGWHALLINDDVEVRHPLLPDHIFKDFIHLNRSIEQGKLKLQ